MGTFKNSPAKCLKVTSDICIPFLAAIGNQEHFLNKRLPQKLKLTDITPVHKKENSTKMKNYRPLGVLPTVWKIFDRSIQKKEREYIKQLLSPFPCGCRKWFSSRNALVWLIQSWKHQLEKNDFAGAILIDLSKAFDSINYDLLIAKFYAYGFGKNALDLVYDYLKNIKHRVKINTTFSTWAEIISDEKHESVLCRLLFNICFNDLFIFLQDMMTRTLLPAMKHLTVFSIN